MVSDIPSRDLGRARNAFDQRDVRMSMNAHLLSGDSSEPHTKGSGQYLKSIVYGAMDGIVTTFALVAGVAGAEMQPHIVVVLGLATLIADGISMGLGDYVSSKAEYDYQSTEQDRERWELENFPEGEVNEMIEMYVSKGISLDDATLIIKTMSKYESFFVDHMLVQELGILPPDPDDHPARSGLVTFISFMIFGSIPLVAFLIISSSEDKNFNIMFSVACILTGITLLLLGAFKGKISGSSIMRSALMVFTNGVLASAAAYLIGHLLSGLLKTSSQLAH